MRLIHIATAIAAFSLPTAEAAVAQTGEPSVPVELSTMDFLLGEWTVSGAFRTPDFVGEDRTLWYLLPDGVTRFDGTSWTSFAPGVSPRADSIRTRISGTSDPFLFSHPRDVIRIQDDFVLLIDDGSTSGSTFIFFDSAERRWTATAVHAPTNSMTHSSAPFADGLPVFVGRGSDRRGDRTFRRRYEIIDPDHYRIRTDVSFDEGVTWIVDQIVQEVRRR